MDVQVVNPGDSEVYLYNGHTYIDLSDYIDECIAEGILLEDASIYNPEPYDFLFQAPFRKYVTGFDEPYYKIYGPTFYIQLDKADKDNMLMLILDDQGRYIRDDFKFPSMKTHKVKAITFKSFMMKRPIDEQITLTDEQTIKDFIEAIYTKGKATDKISKYLEKDYDTHIYFIYENCDCVSEFIGKFSCKDGSFTMYKDIVWA